MSNYLEVGIVPPVPYLSTGNRPCPIQTCADGRRIIYGTVTGVVSRCLPDQLDANTKVVEVFVGNRSPLQIAAISPDGQFVAGGDSNGAVYIWTKAREGVAINSFQLNMQYVRISDLCFSDDSKKIAIVGVDKYSKKLGTVIVVDAGNAVGKIEGHTLGINSVTYRQKKPYMIATAGVDGLVCLHSGPPFKMLRRCEGHSGQVFCIRFSPDGDILVSCGADGKLIFWDVKSGVVDHDVELSSTSLYGLAWSTDNSRVVVVGADQKIRIVEVMSGVVVDEVMLGLDPAVSPIGIVWTPTDWVCVCCGNGQLWGYKTEQQKKFRIDQQFIWQGVNGVPTAMALNSVSGRVAIGDAYGGLLFMCTKGSEPRTFNGFKVPSAASVRSVVIGKDLGAVVTVDGIIRVFYLPKDDIGVTSFKPPKVTDTEKSEDLKTLVKPGNKHSAFVRSITHLADGYTALDSTGTGTLGVTSEISWVGTHQFKDCPIKAVSIGNDQAIVVACSAGILYAYPFSSASSRFSLLWSLKLHGKITAVSASLDGTLVAVGITADADYPLEKFGDGRTSIGASPHLVEMYEVDQHETSDGFRFVCVYELHTSEITSLALNASGVHLASADAARNIYVVEVETGKKVITNQWKYHTGKITSLDWAPDGMRLATGGSDKNLYVWDLEYPSRFIHIKDAHQGGVSCVQFIFNNVVLSTGGDGTLVAYELTLGPPPSGSTPYCAPSEPASEKS